jgi:Family of unknown function (DUF5317)
MRIWLIAILLGIALGYLGRGRLRRLADLPLPLGLAALAWLGLALQVGADRLPLQLEYASVLAGNGLVLVFLIGFWILIGPRVGLRVSVAVLALGWTMNTVVIAANGGMPVSPSAAAQVGLPAISAADDRFSKHVVLTHDTVLWPLGDVIPLSLPGGGNVVSPGDFVLALGFLLLVATAMQVPGARRRQAVTCSPT